MHVLRLIPCQATMFASCKKQLSKCICASLVPLGMKWACFCAGDGEVFQGSVMCHCCAVFVRVGIYLTCDVVCCRRCDVYDGFQKKNDTSYRT